MSNRALVLALLVGACVSLGASDSANADNPVAAPRADLPKAAIQAAPNAHLSLYVRVVIDSLYCEKESKWDHATSQDEPYVMMLGIASHRDPSSWVAGRPEVFKDVDSGNNRRFTKQQRVIFQGEVPRNGYIGFEAILWEKDASSDNAVMKLADSVSHSVTDWISSNDHDLKKEMPKLMAALWPMLISGGIYIAGGAEDDRVDEKDVFLSHDELLDLAAHHRHVARRLVFAGGDEGKYWLRYHIEFGEDATREFGVKFTEWDDMVVGNVDRTSGDEIVTVSDEEVPGGDGRFCVQDGTGKLLRSFDAPYAPGDRLAVGDTSGNGVAEIFVASPSNGGLIRVYDYMGALRNRISAPFAKYDGFAVGDVNGDGKAEVVIARHSDRKVYIYSPQNERKLDEFGLNWQFKGTRYTANDTRHDALLVGDVMGDGKAEIIMIENKNDNTSVIRVYNGKGAEVRNSAIAGAFGATFTHNDAAALGDMYGDAKKELILAASEDSKSYSYTTAVIDLASGKRVGSRCWPWYLRHSGFAAGTVLPAAKAQLVVANGSDGSVYIGR